MQSEEVVSLANPDASRKALEEQIHVNEAYNLPLHAGIKSLRSMARHWLIFALAMLSVAGGIATLLMLPIILGREVPLSMVGQTFLGACLSAAICATVYCLAQWLVLVRSIAEAEITLVMNEAEIKSASRLLDKLS